MGTRFDWLDELKLHRWEFLAHEPDVWVACETHTSKVLEDAWQAGQAHDIMTLTIGSYKYQVSMDDFTQKNLITGKVRRLRRTQAMDPVKLQQAMDLCAAYTAMENELCEERRAHQKLQSLVNHLRASPSASQSQESQEKQVLKLQIENQERFFETQLHAERREKEAFKLEAQQVQGQMLQQIRKQKEKNTSLLEILRWERLQASNRGRFYEVNIACRHEKERPSRWSGMRFT